MTINEMKEKKKEKGYSYAKIASGNSAEDFFWGNRESAI